MDSEEEDDIKKDIQENASNIKLMEHQNDRYAIKKIGRGLFDEGEDNLIGSRNVSPFLVAGKNSDSSKEL